MAMQFAGVDDGETRDDDDATANEKYTYIEGVCTRETVYEAFVDHNDEDHGPSKITHVDTLPKETCCAWSKKL